ncbi:MAG: alkyldihydroxyacetonephosphate synthase [Thermodesulfobacteriota bacterium]|nr:alkyldihydroxyacetonephosphate synthase [Thermodesulfobacteriota bacterium]
MTMGLATGARDLLKDRIGEGMPHREIPLEQALACVPDSRLPDHPLITRDKKERLVHSHGQSLPDWVALRQGGLERFPDGVAFPATGQEAQELLHFAAKRDLVIIPYGGGTSVVGHLTVPASDRPVLSLSLERLNRLISVDARSRLAICEAGVRGPDLEAQLRAHGFTLGHYPQSFECSTLGGWVATRSSGQQSSHYGSIETLFAGGEMVTFRGPLVCPPFPASAAGPDLRHLILGSEGRLGILVKAIVRISPIPERDEVWAVFFPSWERAVEAVRSLAGAGVRYSMIRLSSPTETLTNLVLAGRERMVSLLKRYLELRHIGDAQGCMCLIGFVGSRRQVAGARRLAFSILRKHRGVSVGRSIGEAWKRHRFRAPYLRNTLWDMGYAVDTVETAVTWDKVTETMASVEAAVAEALAPWHEGVHLFSHLSHVYPIGSSIYTTLLFRVADTPEETLARWRAIKTSASHAIVRTGGTISHQHGVGLDHRAYLGAEKGPVGLEILRETFAHMDPEHRMNPGKLVEGQDHGT